MSPRRIRRARRGAALVESLIFILTLILMHIVLLYMQGAYTAKLKTGREARRDSWPVALQACQGATNTNVTSGEGDGSLGSVSGQMSTARQIAKGTTLTKPLDTSLETRTATATGKSSGHETQHGALQPLSMTTTSNVMCNEKQREISDGDIRQTINSLYGSLL